MAGSPSASGGRGEVGRGVGVELRPFGQDQITRLEAFLEEAKQATVDSPHQRVRGYNGAEQLRSAREGDLAERVALERVFGKAVWEALLQNPRLTAPEVSRIAASRLERALVARAFEE